MPAVPVASTSLLAPLYQVSPRGPVVTNPDCVHAVPTVKYIPSLGHATHASITAVQHIHPKAPESRKPCDITEALISVVLSADSETVQISRHHRREFFCNHPRKCFSQFQLKTGSLRDLVFEVERGVCQSCGVNAHALYEHVKRLSSKTDKKEALLSAGKFKNLTEHRLSKLLRVRITEGEFWEVNHKIAVSEGGGECDISNLETLCVPCHLQITREQQVKRSHKRKSEESSITTEAEVANFSICNNVDKVNQAVLLKRGRQRSKTASANDYQKPPVPIVICLDDSDDSDHALFIQSIIEKNKTTKSLRKKFQTYDMTASNKSADDADEDFKAPMVRKLNTGKRSKTGSEIKSIYFTKDEP